MIFLNVLLFQATDWLPHLSMQQKQTSVYFDLCACVTESLFFFGMKVITLHWISPVSCSVDSLMMTLTSVQRQTIVLIVELFQEKSTKAQRIEKPRQAAWQFCNSHLEGGAWAWARHGRGQGWQEVWRVPGCSFTLKSAMFSGNQTVRKAGRADGHPEKQQQKPPCKYCLQVFAQDPKQEFGGWWRFLPSAKTILDK